MFICTAFCHGSDSGSGTQSQAEHSSHNNDWTETEQKQHLTPGTNERAGATQVRGITGGTDNTDHKT